MVTEISIKAGSLVDSLLIRTNKGKEKKWGGDGGHLQRTWRVPTGSSFLGFHGGVGGHLHSLGVTLAWQGGNTAAAATDRHAGGTAAGGGENLLTPVVKANLYSADRVRRACAQFLAFNATPPSAPESVAAALATMLKYADNLLAAPLDPKVSRIRLANGFFDRKIGRLPGGGGVIRAMGFELAADDEGRLHYVFRRGGAGGGLEGLRGARQTLSDVAASLKPSTVA